MCVEGGCGVTNTTEQMLHHYENNLILSDPEWNPIAFHSLAMLTVKSEAFTAIDNSIPKSPDHTSDYN